MLDFIAYNRVTTFVTKLVTVSDTVTDLSYVDTSPTGIFTGPKGTILQKRGHIISYKYPGDTSFTPINFASNSIKFLLEKYSVILNRGVNRNVTWVKTSSDTETIWSNRGSVTNVFEICEIKPSVPCVTPIITYFHPTYTFTPTPTTYEACDCDQMTVRTLIINSTGKCEPSPTDPGTYGEIRICENYIYVYDGTRWKRSELTTY